MRVADYVAGFLYDAGARSVFLVSGGGMMHLSDAIYQHGRMEYVCTHHEQAAAMAAVAYARYNDSIGAAFFTTGCGGTNAITGLLDAWQDSTPCIFVSGQVKRLQTTRGSNLPLRQFGVQEADIISVVAPLTKYAVAVEDAGSIAYHMEKALYLATHGRKGPVWLDIPQDVQSAQIDAGAARHFSPSELAKEYKEEPTQEEIGALQALLASSSRPIVVAGQGIRLAGAIPQFRRFVEKYNLPFVTPYLGINLLPTAHPLYIGRIGAKGTRAGNFAIQNSDLVISIGSRLDVSALGYDYKNFAREAARAVIDIDPVEHRKETIRIDLFINADAKRFFEAASLKAGNYSQWAEKCRHWRGIWPVCLPEYADDSKGINLYYFVDRLSAALRPDSVVVSDAGSAFYAVSQAISLAEGQRYITSGCQAEMGFTLPAAIGASIARGGGEVFGVTGDGSFQMNIQELQTAVHRKLPIRIFVWNNNGYLSIRTTQRKFLGGRLIGTDSSSGLSFPSVEKIARAYGIKYFRADRSAKLDALFRGIMECKGPVLCEVMCNPDQEIVPTVSSVMKPDGTMVSRPMEDMYPFMGREELKREMVAKPLDE